MVRKHQIYSATRLFWAVASFGSAIVLYSGNAEPYVSPSQLPGGASPVGLFGWGLGLSVVGWLVISRLQRRSWLATGRELDLTPDGTTPLGMPDLSGSVRGRPVRVHTISRDTGGGGGETGNSKTTFTRVEAELAGVTEDGLVISIGDDDYGDLASVTVDGVSAVGPEALARDVLSGPVPNAIREAEGVDAVTVGDAAGAVSDAMPDTSGSWLGGLVERGVKKGLSDDASTVAVENRGVLLDPGRAQQQVDAVVAVADAFEAATADGQQGTGPSTPPAEG